MSVYTYWPKVLIGHFVNWDKNVDMQIFLRNFIHEVTSIITFDFRDNYSHIQQNSTCKAGSAQKRKMHVQLARLHLQHLLFHKSFAE